MAQMLRGIVVAIAIVVALLVGVTLLDTVGNARVVDERVERDAAVFGDGYTGGTVTVNDAVAVANDQQVVYKTTGYAATLTGAPDSKISSSGGYDLRNDTTWHVSLWASVDSGQGSADMEAASISDGEVRVVYNGSTSEWLAYYYRHDTADSYTATVATSGDEVGNLTNIQVAANGTHLTLFRNTTQGSTANITTANTADAPVHAGNWDGRLEELRTFSDNLSSSDRSALYSNPVEQQPSLPRTMRLMYDNPQDQAVVMPLQGTDATASNVTFTKDGFAEVTADRNSDYTFERDGPAVGVADQGAGTSAIDSAPIAYVSYDKFTTSIFVDFSGFFEVAQLIPMIIVVVLIIRLLRDRDAV